MSMRGTSAAGLVLLTLVAVLAVYFLQNKQITTDTSASATTTPEFAQTRFVPYGLKEYRSTAYDFSLLYPQDLVVKEHIEGGNAITITFQNVKKQDGFQIFIVPYEESQVS